MSSKKIQKGFTLAEILISISLLTLVIFAATNLLVQSLRINADNQNKITAYGLAVEQIEAVRSIRDSNWLLNLEDTADKKSAWGEDIFDGIDGTYFVIDRATPNGCTVQDINGLTNCVPWKLTKLNNFNSLESDNVNDVKIYKSTEGIFSHLSNNNTVTKFRAYIKIERADFNVSANGSTEKKYKVLSHVEWNEDGAMKKVELNTELTNWKPST